MNKNRKTSGVVLTRKNIGEADRLLSVFTKDMGKIKIIAKGSRKIKSKMASHIEPFTVAQFQLVEGKTFYILTGAEKILYFNTPTDDMELYKGASYLCELVDMTHQEDESSPNIFNLLSESLKTIRDLPANKRSLVLRYFELKLLTELGYKPNFHVCKKCQKKISEHDSYIGGFEGVVCTDCQHQEIIITKSLLKILRLLQKESLTHILSVRNIESYNEDLISIIHPYLKEVLPRPTRSLEL